MQRTRLVPGRLVPGRLVPGLATAVLAVFALSACEVETDTDATDDTFDPQLDTAADRTGAAADTARGLDAQEVYEARLEGVGGSQGTGVATVTVRDDELQVTVAVTGLDPDTRVPQHIHMNASCDDAGGILINLDDDLSGPGEGEPRGDAYPETDDQGRLRYEASRSLRDLRTALGPAAGLRTGDTATAGQPGDTAMPGAPGQTGAAARTGAADLDLANRVVNLHGPDMAPIVCGPLDRLQAGQTPGGAD